MKKRRPKTVSKNLLISTLFLICSSNELKSFTISVCFFLFLFLFFVLYLLKTYWPVGNAAQFEHSVIKASRHDQLLNTSLLTWSWIFIVASHIFVVIKNSSAVTSNNLFFVFISLPNLIISLRRTDSGNILVYLTFQTYSCWKISDLSLHLILQITGSVSCIHWITINYHFRIFWENINFYYLDWQGPFG